MSEQFDILRITTEKLDRLQLKYYVTGSFVLFLFGEVRLTNDIDIVVDLPPGRINEFIASFDPEEYYFSDDAIRDAVRDKFMFNIIYKKTMTKLDIMISKGRPYDRVCLARAQRLKYQPDYSPSVSSAEDIVLNKMLFYKEGGSEKHIRDIVSLLKIGDKPIDVDYVRQWAATLDVLDVWESISKKMNS